MRSFLLILGCFFSLFSFSQNLALSNKLQTRINSLENEDYVRVRIEFVENVNCTQLSQQFKTDKTPISDRSKKVITALTDQAKTSQMDVLFFLEDNPSVKELKPACLNCSALFLSIITIECCDVISNF